MQHGKSQVLSVICITNDPINYLKNVIYSEFCSVVAKYRSLRVVSLITNLKYWCSAICETIQTTKSAILCKLASINLQLVLSFLD